MTLIPPDAKPRERCVCGKWAYQTRKKARIALKAFHPGLRGMSVYRCQEVPGHFHYGHLDLYARRLAA